MSQINEQPLSTFLSTSGTNAPATTASALIEALSPIFYNFAGDTSLGPHYAPGDLTSMSTLQASQEKYSALLYPPTGTPNGLSGGDCIGLVFQGMKEILAKLPITLTATTNGSGVATVDLTSYSLANSPIVQLTAQNPVSNVAPIVADITALSNTSLSILTQEALSTTTPISTLVHIVLFPQ